jgi:hypothetical protein
MESDCGYKLLPSLLEKNNSRWRGRFVPTMYVHYVP